MTSYDSILASLEEKVRDADKRLGNATNRREKCEIAGHAGGMVRAKSEEEACYGEWLGYAAKIVSLVQQRDGHK